MKISLGSYRLIITPSRWPWHDASPRSSNSNGKYGWGKVRGYGRFGGGWNWNLGFQLSGSTLLLNLLLGQIRLTLLRKKQWPV